MLYFDEDYGSNDIRLIELSPELLKILKEEKSFGELFIKHNGLSQKWGAYFDYLNFSWDLIIACFFPPLTRTLAREKWEILASSSIMKLYYVIHF